MSKREPPLCETYGVKITVMHITECREYEEKRREYNISKQVCQALEPDHQTCNKLISFLKTTNHYDHL